MNEPIPVLVNFDIEPDPREIVPGRLDRWAGFERLVAIIRDVRPRLADATSRPVHFNWYLRMDEQIQLGYGDAAWVAHEYAEELAELRTAGDLFGVHVHAWRWERSGWVADWGNEDFVTMNVRLALDVFSCAFGEQCLMYRSGDRFTSAALIEVLREAGVRYELTLEPGQIGGARLVRAERGTGAIPDQRYVPRRPYPPSIEDPRRPSPDTESAGDLWMIPVTTLNPNPLLAKWLRVARRIRHPVAPLERPVGLHALCDSARFWRWVEAGLAAQATPYLSVVLRTDEFLEPARAAAFVDKFDKLVRDPLAKQLAFTGPAAVVAVAKGSA